MIRLGQHNTLIVLRNTSVGLYLGDQEGGEVLLPNKYVPENIDVNDEIEVFIYKDSEDRIIATTLEPRIYLNDFASLRVKAVNDVGAFLDWGLEKDLMVPYREQTFRMHENEYHVVYLFEDKVSGRLIATSKLDKFLSLDTSELSVNQEVDIMLWAETDLGYNVVINKKYKGLLYYNEIFKRVEVGDELKAYVKTIREDGKVDVMLQLKGHLNIEPNAQKIMKLLEVNQGFMPYADHSNAEEIADVFEMSKKAFKKAIGTLYKQQHILIKEDGIYLNQMD
jgi:predicted RNA-binding protein (virulence factor B family)